MEYDPSTEQLTVRGPIQARLVLNALGVSYANSDKVASPDYTFVLDRVEFGPVVKVLDDTYIADICGRGDHVAAQELSGALFHLIARGTLE